MRQAVATAEERGWLGSDVLGSGFTFRVHVRVGAGAYICGEETALIESLEGKRGVVRAKPPLPAHVGLWGKPTVVNNVISLATATAILADGAAGYRALGTEHSHGTQVFQLAGNIARGGIFETPFGITLAELVDDIGGGTASGRTVRAVQIGGPLGAYLPVEKFDQPIDYETLAAIDAMVGHGGIVVFDDTVDMAAQARFAMEFCAAESCGKCTPCRIGSTRGVELIDRIIDGVDVTTNIVTLVDLCEVMTDGSLCALGGLAPMPVRSALTHFADDFHLAVAPEERVEGDADELQQRHRSGYARARSQGTHPGTHLGEAHRRRSPRRGGRGHIGDARRRPRRSRHTQAVCHRPARPVRLLPSLPRRDRGPRGHARLVHHALRCGHGGDHPVAETRTPAAAG